MGQNTYNFEFRFYQSAKHAKAVAACACCFSSLPDGVTRTQIQQKMNKAMNICLQQARESEEKINLLLLMTTVTQMVAKELGCIGILVNMDSTSNFALDEGRFF